MQHLIVLKIGFYVCNYFNLRPLTGGLEVSLPMAPLVSSNQKADLFELTEKYFRDPLIHFIVIIDSEPDGGIKGLRHPPPPPPPRFSTEII